MKFKCSKSYIKMKILICKFIIIPYSHERKIQKWFYDSVLGTHVKYEIY